MLGHDDDLRPIAFGEQDGDDAPNPIVPIAATAICIVALALLILVGAVFG